MPKSTKNSYPWCTDGQTDPNYKKSLAFNNIVSFDLLRYLFAKFLL